MKKFPERIDSKYRFVLLASQRAEQIVVGSAGRMETASPKATRIGMEEIVADAIEWDYGPAEEPEEELPEEAAPEAEATADVDE